MKFTLLISLAVFSSLANAQTVTNAVPRSNHVIVLVEENHELSAVMNGGMPYLDGLAKQYAQATNYFGDTHPSIGNYLMMTSGVVFTNNDSYGPTITIDNIARQMIAQNITWKAYAEALPSVGYTGASTGEYARKHNPLSYYSDVVNSSTQKQNLVPIAQFATDLANDALPQYSFVVPDLDDDAHDGTLQEADTWLQKNIAPLFKNSQFQNDGILVITFDEGDTSDSAHGGGNIPCVVIGPHVKPGYKATAVYQHENLLSLTCAALGINSCPGAGAAANDMSEFFQ